MLLARACYLIPTTLLVSTAMPSAASAAEETIVLGASCEGDHSTPMAWPEPNLGAWETREFDGQSTYELVEQNGNLVLHAQTEGKASVLYREQKVDISETPIITWSWRVDSVYDNPNEQTKAGDDFPARLYVVIQTGFLPWETHAINYVFASSTPAETSWLNPYTEKAKMIAVQSGPEAAGKWHCERRNVAQDFADAFPGEFPKPPNSISGYAIMVDGDNGGFSGRAHFGGFAFEPG